MGDQTERKGSGFFRRGTQKRMTEVAGQPIRRRPGTT